RHTRSDRDWSSDVCSSDLVMRAERVGADTLLARIVRLVGEAQRTRAPIQRLADVVSAWFVPAVIAVAALTFATWSLIGPPPRLRSEEHTSELQSRSDLVCR